MEHEYQNLLQNFVAVQSYEVLFETSIGEQSVLLEVRAKSDRSWQVFTIINHAEVYASSIQSLLLLRSEYLSLSILHNVSVLWDGVYKRATLVEMFGKNQSEPSQIAIRLSLKVDDNIYTSSECISFTEAMFELHDSTGPNLSWQLRTCYDCRFSRPAFLDPIDDRNELRCYRDVPEVFREVEAKTKFSSQDARLSGDVFVSAFHRCAGWQPIK